MRKSKFQEYILSLLPEDEKLIITAHRGAGKLGEKEWP